MLDGRVKTLHPRIHAGILAVRDNPEHVADLARTGIPPIDLVVVNLYPFQETAAREGAAFDDVVEMIDVGGPAMIRAAAKNHAHVGVVVDPADYAEVADELRAAAKLSPPTLRRLAAKAFRHTADYDNAIAAWLADRVDGISRTSWPRELRVSGEKVQDLRYGENPHQTAAFYRVPEETAGLAGARVLQGKELSFNNILDLDAALALAAELPGQGCVIVKHGNPCGVALGASAEEAFRRALACDPTSAFGGVIAFNTAVDAAAATALAEAFYEAVVGPDVAPDAQEILGRKKNLRVLAAGTSRRLPAHRARPAPRHRRPAGPGLGRGDRGRAPGAAGHAPRPGAGRVGGAAVRLDRGQAREVERHRLRAGGPHGGDRGRADEPRGLRAHRHAQGPGGVEDRSAPGGGGDGLGRLLPLPRWDRRGGRRRHPCGGAAGRLGAGRRGDRRRRRPRPGHGVHRRRHFRH
jgi:hypothetical protein